jgi:hypothetical protein
LKIAYVTGHTGRGETRERQRRERAATPTLAARHPQLSQLRLDFKFIDVGPFTPAPQSTILHPPARAYFVFPCPYSDCDGEFDLTAQIAQIIRNDETCSEGKLACAGRRHHGIRGVDACGLTLEFQIDAKRG